MIARQFWFGVSSECTADIGGNVGEAFDKAARLLGLELKPNGGAALEILARSGDAKAYPFTMPLRKHQDCNFSYAGLKTAVRMAVERDLSEQADDADRQVFYPSPFPLPTSFHRLPVDNRHTQHWSSHLA